ncbi:MAG TPA: ACT domain-containing protein, partial [Myxococcota bacterium]|nr:ACT domain-containing protein [Myxococcota bacterium]
LVPLDSMLAHVNGVYNAVRVQSRALGPITITGQGAGMMPTAAAVVSDIIELARNIRRGTSGRLPHLAFHRDLVRLHALQPADETECPFYLRFTVRDEPGVIAQIASLLGAHHISIRKMVQEEIGGVGELASGKKRPVPVVILTHTAREGAIRKAVMAIDLLPFVTQPTLTLRVEDAV